MAKVILLPVFVIAVMASQQALAQVPPIRYQPSRPTISPYLNLLRQYTGPLPNYHSLVRPQIQQLNNNQQQQYQLQQQRTAIQTNNQQLLRIGEAAAAPTGSGAVFRNYSHYYPALGGR
jgi:hypothetical protein